MSKILFTNKCNIPEWMPEYKRKFREDADEFFKKALMQVPFLKDCNLEITYFLHGVGSIVAKIVSSSGETYVMKTTESFNHTSNEIYTYKAAIDAGIKVPKLFFDGVQDELPFLIIEYFKEGTLYDKLNTNEITLEKVAEIRSNFFIDLKKIEGKGYEWSVQYENGVLEGNYKDIDEFANDWFGRKEFIDIANTHFPSIAWEEKLHFHVTNMKNHNAGKACRLGTFDFQTGHIFTSNPPTLFDASLKLEPEFFDLAQLIIPFPDGDTDNIFLNKVVYAKYQTTFGQINFDQLKTAVWLQTFRKATNLLKRSDERRLKMGLYALEFISNEDVLRGYIESYLR